MAARPEVGGEVAQLGLEAGERLEGADDMALEDMPKGDAEFAGHGAFVAAAARGYGQPPLLRYLRAARLYSHRLVNSPGWCGCGGRLAADWRRVSLCAIFNDSKVRIALSLLLLFVARMTAHGDYREFCKLAINPSIDSAIKRTAEVTLKEFPKLTADNLAISVIDLTKSDTVGRADYRGDASFYPASLVKLFFMVETFHQGQMTPEIERALREMIRVSDNDAAAFLLDILTDTASGSELEGKALEQFIDRRRKLNRYFASLGYDISAMIKPWSFGPFGRDMQIMGENLINRNRASANSFASLLFWIVRRQAVSPQASEAMLALLERPLAPPRPEENQVNGFFGEALPANARLWSKEGDTSEVRHDAAYVELPDGRKLMVVILTRGAVDDKTLLPSIGKHLLAELER